MNYLFSEFYAEKWTSFNFKLNLNYEKGVFDCNKEDFATAEDIKDSIGAIVNELLGNGQGEDVIDNLCARFYEILNDG